MTTLRIVYGLERLPRTIAADDDRLPAIDLDGASLRLNSVPLPIAAWNSSETDHAARIMAVLTWLLASCGDYNEALRRGVTNYLNAIAAHVTQHHDSLAAGLAQFDGLYRVEDWFWSALRPLPRAWWQQDGAWLHADLAFWNGHSVITVSPRDLASEHLPDSLQHFWSGERLPVSPFRRAFPAGPGAISLRPSFR